MQSDELKRRISAGRGDALADLVLRNARIINVFTDEIETADIAISGNSIVGVGTYHGRKEVDLHGKYVCPGLIDGHIHIESSMLCGPAFEQAVLPHGTTAVVTDPHEISNVAGLEGLDFMLETTKNLTLSVYFMLPSCVPATDLDESGAVLNAEQLRPYYGDPRVLGLAELMNAYGTVRCDPKILQKIRDCTEAGKIVDGHAPLLSDKDLNAYIAAGVQSDHECSNIEEAMEKLRRGQYIMIREGTAAKNMEALMPLFREPYCSRCMLVTDDKHPGDLLDSGHIDSNIRKAIRLGADPAVAVKMATLVPAQYFGFKQRGAVAPGYRADLVVVPDLESFTVEQVYKNGTLVAEHGKTLKPAPLDIDRVRFSHVMDSFDLDEITLQDLELRESGEQERVICLNRGELLTEEKIIPFQRHPGKAPGVDPEHNIVKLAVFERHHHSGHVGIGFLGNFSLKCGAVASSIAHDSHNLIVAGDNDTDMMLAGNTVRKNKGGLAFVADGQVVAELALPVAGLMSTESAESVAAKMQALNDALKAHGVAEDIGIFMTLAFVSLPVIPKLRLNTYGIIDVAQQKVVSWDGTQTAQWLSLRPQGAGHLLTLQEFAGYGPAELSTVSALLAGICQTALQTVADLDTITAIEKDQEVDFCICGRTSLKRFEALLINNLLTHNFFLMLNNFSRNISLCKVWSVESCNLHSYILTVSNELIVYSNVSCEVYKNANLTACMNISYASTFHTLKTTDLDVLADCLNLLLEKFSNCLL